MGPTELVDLIMRVAGLYAVCDLDFPAGTTTGPRVSTFGYSFSVREFARLSEGPPVLLRELGWSSQPSVGATLGLWAYLTEQDIINDVRTVVLPDDAETSNEEHPWMLLASILTARGVPVTATQLRNVPYDILLSPRLRSKLSR